MSGGKGGSKTTETTIPDWIKQPAQRNLQRAEDVQRIPFMPYYGADVAAFTPTQNAAFDTNIGAAEAFGLLAPGHGLTATSGMPTPTDFDGFTGYSSQPMYESALAELKAKQPGAVAQYDALFGGNVPTTWGGNPRFRGDAGGANVPTHNPTTPTTNPYDTSTWSQALQDSHKEQINPNYATPDDIAKPTGTNYKKIVAEMNAKKHTADMNMHRDKTGYMNRKM